MGDQKDNKGIRGMLEGVDPSDLLDHFDEPADTGAILKHLNADTPEFRLNAENEPDPGESSERQPLEDMTFDIKPRIPVDEIREHYEGRIRGRIREALGSVPASLAAAAMASGIRSSITSRMARAASRFERAHRREGEPTPSEQIPVTEGTSALRGAAAFLRASKVINEQHRERYGVDMKCFDRASDDDYTVEQHYTVNEETGRYEKVGLMLRRGADEHPAVAGDTVRVGRIPPSQIGPALRENYDAVIGNEFRLLGWYDHKYCGTVAVLDTEHLPGFPSERMFIDPTHLQLVEHAPLPRSKSKHCDDCGAKLNSYVPYCPQCEPEKFDRFPAEDDPASECGSGCPVEVGDLVRRRATTVPYGSRDLWAGVFEVVDIDVDSGRAEVQPHSGSRGRLIVDIQDLELAPPGGEPPRCRCVLVDDPMSNERVSTVNRFFEKVEELEEKRRGDRVAIIDGYPGEWERCSTGWRLTVAQRSDVELFAHIILDDGCGDPVGQLELKDCDCDSPALIPWSVVGPFNWNEETSDEAADTSRRERLRRTSERLGRMADIMRGAFDEMVDSDSFGGLS